MKNKISDGKTIQLASESYPGKASGDVVVVGRLHAVAATDNPARTGEIFEADTEGVFDLPKLSEGITQGTRVWWDGVGVGASPTGNMPIGIAWASAATGATEIPVKINFDQQRYNGTGPL